MRHTSSGIVCSRWLSGRLRELAFEHNRRWSDEAHDALIKILFTSLCNNNPAYIETLFPGGQEGAELAKWKLGDAQGAQDGAEYTEAARGKRCGHIFKNGEASYACKTCAIDVTCVLCARCFEASDHEGHQILVTTSLGSSGCCDCGDEEAWVRPVNCSIHTAHATEAPEPAKPLPSDLQDSIRITISRALDFVCDVFSCAANERTRNQGHEGEKAVRDNESYSRLKGQHYQGTDETEQDDEFCLVLWNDEKHTLDEVTENVARALKQRKRFGLEKAKEVDDVGRSIIEYSKDVDGLIKKAQMLERIKVTVTIRSARDTFRERMCGTIVGWLSDIAGCSVGDDSQLLINTICEEMLKPWRMGSGAGNLEVGKGGITDHAQDEDRLDKMRQQQHDIRMMNLLRVGRTIAAQRAQPVTITTVDTDTGTIAVTPAPQGAGDDTEIIEDVGDIIIETGNVDAMDLDDSEIGTDDDELVLDAIGAELREQQAAEDATWGSEHVMQSLQAPSTTDEESEDEQHATSQPNPEHLITKIPQTSRMRPATAAAPPYWSKADADWKPTSKEYRVYEDFSRRMRVDFLILYDLRMWKQLRTDLRYLYIRTVIKVPYFKRVLGLRFASVYTYLAQLYLIADREPEHSIIKLSLQMLTTPSITDEIIDRGNFLTKLLAILYTFLTKRQVDYPHNVDLKATMSLDSQVTSNRRICHFFHDMHFLLDSKYVQEQIRMHDEYLQQCIDFVKLYQGICPNVRALGEHVEYESDLWISASIIGRDITKMTRHFCEAFAWSRNQNPGYICRAIRQAAKATTINSMGAERERFHEADLRRETSFELVFPYEHQNSALLDVQQEFEVIHFVVENEPMSFHHTLHFMLSWLVDCGKSMSKDQLRQLIIFDHRQLEMADLRSSLKATVPEATSQQYLLALFDVPLRVCAWLAQMRAGMWVRNGMTLRHQVSTVRNVATRDNSHQRDLFLLQVALAILPSGTLLVSMARRFGMNSLLSGLFNLDATWQDDQFLDVAEDFIHLLIILLSDRTLLYPPEESQNAQELAARKEIAHALCFKPLSHSELVNRLSERITQEMDQFPDIVRQMTNYKAPEGLQDTGSFELKPDFYDEVDPYNAWYSKNQREEAENVWRQRKAKQLQQPLSEIAYEPNLRPIRAGVFCDIGQSTQDAIFGKIIWNALSLLTGNTGELNRLPSSRLEAFAHPVLHLVLIAISEDRLTATKASDSFSLFAIFCGFEREQGEEPILALLLRILQNDQYEGLRPKVHLTLKRLRDKRPQDFDSACAEICSRFSLGDPSEILRIDSRNDSSQDLAEKRRKAQERNARVLAGMKAQQKQFEQSQIIDWGFDPDQVDSDEDMVADETKTWHYPEGTCIFCQEDTNDQRLYGTLTFICESSLFRQTDLNDKDYISEATSAPQNLDHSAEAIRPYGVAGQNVQKIQKVRADGSIIFQETRGLGKGFPSNCHEKGIVSTGCGHLMHFSCFETYLSATDRRQSQQIARDHPERSKLREFICPLCKALGNAFFPIMWKPKAFLNPQALQTDAFEQFVTGTVPLLISTGAEYPQYEKIHQNYASEALIPGLATKVAELGKTSVARAVSPHPGPVGPMRNSLFQMPSFISSSGRDVVGESSTNSAQSVAVSELLKAYARLNDTILRNKLFSRSVQTPSSFITHDTLVNSDILASSLGFSVSAIEIAQRGVASQGPTFLNAISESQLTQLRIQSETASAYVAICGLQNSAYGRLSNEPRDVSMSQINQLLGFGSDVTDDQMSRVSPLFSKDIFVFLAECSVFMVPHFHLNIHDILRLCYFAEIVKVVVAFLQSPKLAWEYARQDMSSRTSQSGAMEEVAKSKCSPQESQDFSTFVQHIWYQVRDICQPSDCNYLDNPNERFRFDHLLRLAVASYILPFLRKSILLMHVRYGVDYSLASSDIDPQDSEVNRLSRVLNLPIIDRFIGSMLTNSPAANQTNRLVQHWVSHSLRHCMRQQARQADSSVTSLAARSTRIHLPHPGIFELVALPHTYDALNAEAMSRRCPNSGKDLIEASICLFCGAIFCGQAQCCAIAPMPNSDERYGGCMQHQNKCAGNIGMFINIRKCAAFFNNEKQGSWAQAPYLDEHGETDMGLRRRNQLFLNRKRYDKLFREVWLHHGVPSTISRKLEADANTGGWETL